jgi:hypothetical protein
MDRGISALASGVVKSDRAVHVYNVPAKIAAATGVKTVGVVELTGYEELMATRRAGTEPMRLASELARESLKQVNGKPINDEEADTFWSSPKNTKLRTLVITAYNSVNSPTNEEAATFLQSCQIEVG